MRSRIMLNIRSRLNDRIIAVPATVAYLTLPHGSIKIFCAKQSATNWEVIEYATGYAIGRGKTRKEAGINALQILVTIGVLGPKDLERYTRNKAIINR